MSLICKWLFDGTIRTDKNLYDVPLKMERGGRDVAGKGEGGDGGSLRELEGAGGGGGDKGGEPSPRFIWLLGWGRQ
jgi:hypothetical protein